MGLAQEFRSIIDVQPADWSDMYFSLVLQDEATLDEARLYMAPAQLERTAGSSSHFTFHISHTQGYGSFPDLVESCLAKLDAATIIGELTVDQIINASDRNYTQGPGRWDAVAAISQHYE